MNTKAYLAFDLGASSGRAILGLFEEHHIRMQEIHRFPTPLIEEGNRLCWDVEVLWQELQAGYQKALEIAPGLRSLSVDSWAVDYVPLDQDGIALRKAYCYRDPRTQGMMDTAFERVPPEDLYDATGIQFMPFNTVYQLLADKTQEPDLLNRTAHRLMIADYFHYLFCGKMASECSNASSTQLLDVRKRDWATPLMLRLGLSPSTWPKVVPPGTLLGQTPERIHVVAGCTHDTASAVAAVPADMTGKPWAYLSSGTWSLLGVERSEPILSRAAFEANFTNEAGLDRTIRFLKNLTGLWVLQECEREWKAVGATYTYDTLMAEAEAAAPPSSLLDLDEPRFNLRGDMVQKIRAYCDENEMTVPQTRGEIVRLILESLAEAYRIKLRLLEKLIGETIEVLHIVGGGSRNALLCQMTADACQCEVIAGPAEATALGNLLIQVRTMGDLPPHLSIRDIVLQSVDLQHYKPRR